jgi:hypothetical protein
MAHFMDLNTRRQKIYFERIDFIDHYSEDELRRHFRFGRDGIEVS